VAKGVFTTKVLPVCDALPEIRYHFPSTYLNQVRQTVGDWIVYYEPRREDANPGGRAGRQAYFATARVERVETDGRRQGYYYAFLSEYLEFDSSVPFKIGSTYLERGLVKEDGTTNKGAFGSAVRTMSHDEYETIVKLDFHTTSDKTMAHDTRRLIQPQKKILLPDDPRMRPHPQFLSYHRSNIFKG
jgi:putative restriction endonuclease